MLYFIISENLELNSDMKMGLIMIMNTMYVIIFVNPLKSKNYQTFSMANFESFKYFFTKLIVLQVSI